MYIDEKTFHMMMSDLYSLIKLKFDYVVGVERGGLHVSLPISQKLNIPHTSIKISWYDGNFKRKEPIIDVDNIKEKDNILVCDDLIDSGSTFLTIKNMFPLKKIKYACLFFNLESDFRPDYFSRIKPTEWIDFFWENKLQTI